MDLWDLIRVSARRWYVLLPLLVIVGAATYSARSNAKPEYTAHSAVLVRETPRTTPLAKDQVASANPFSQLGMTVTAEALRVRATSGEIRRTLRERGLSTTYDIVRTDDRTPILTVTVRGKTPAVVTATLTAVLDGLDTDLQAQQASVLATANTVVVVQRLDGIGAVASDYGGKQRATFLTFGVGAILALAFTVLFDVALRARRRDQQALDQVATSGWQTGDASLRGQDLSGLERERAGLRP